MTHDAITAAIPGVNVRVGDTGGFLWLTYETTAHNGQQLSWSRRAPLDPSQQDIDALKADLEAWQQGVQEQ